MLLLANYELNASLSLFLCLTSTIVSTISTATSFHPTFSQSRTTNHSNITECTLFSTVRKSCFSNHHNNVTNLILATSPAPAPLKYIKSYLQASGRIQVPETILLQIFFFLLYDYAFDVGSSSVQVTIQVASTHLSAG